MTEEQVNGDTDEVAEPADVEAAANDEDDTAKAFAADLAEVVRGQEEGIVTHW